MLNNSIIKKFMLFCLCSWFHFYVALASVTENFDRSAVGQSPAGWENGFYGAKGSPIWAVTADKDAPSSPNLLRQSGNAVYNWLVKAKELRKDGFVECNAKIYSGKEDPEAGLIWRFIDGKNYYYVRANAIENNLVVYKMTQGKKVSLKSADIKVRNSWHRIRVEYKNSDISVHFDGKAILALKDSTIQVPGSFGFFTTADTVALFDDFYAGD